MKCQFCGNEQSDDCCDWMIRYGGQSKTLPICTSWNLPIDEEADMGMAELGCEGSTLCCHIDCGLKGFVCECPVCKQTIYGRQYRGRLVVYDNKLIHGKCEKKYLKNNPGAVKGEPHHIDPPIPKV